MRNKKILLSVIFLLFSLLPIYAQYDSENDFETKLSEDGRSVWIIKYVGKNQDVNIPPKIKRLPVSRIDNNAFEKLYYVKSVTIPDSVTSIGWWAFNGCYLTSVKIPDSVISIGNSAFHNWTLTEINVDSRNTAYSSEDGVLYNKNKTKLIQYPPGKDITSFSIPNSVISIEKSAFYRNFNLVHVDIPDSVTSIGDSAFSNNGNLTSVTIGNRVKSIGDHAFYSCGKLTSVTIGNSVESMGYMAFSHSGLISVKIPNSVTRIGGNAFYYCRNLISVTFEGSISKEVIYYKDIYDEYNIFDKYKIYKVNDTISYDAFHGDLLKKFYEEDEVNGTPGTYTTTAPIYLDSKWTRQP